MTLIVLGSSARNTGRRNDRILQKFYDAVYIDRRDGKEKSGKDLFNGRISRNHKKDSENLHPCRSRKVRKGHISIRRQRVSLKPGSYVKYNDEVLQVHGTHTRTRKTKAGVIVKNTNVQFVAPASNGRKSADIKKCPHPRLYITPVFASFYPNDKQVLCYIFC